MDQGAHAHYIHCYNLLFGNVSWSYRSIFLQVRRVTQQKDQRQKASSYKPGDETELQSQLLPKALFSAAIAAAILCASGVLFSSLSACALSTSTTGMTSEFPPFIHLYPTQFPRRETVARKGAMRHSGKSTPIRVKKEPRQTHTHTSWKAVLQHSFPRTSILKFSHFFMTINV